jgi:Lon protease-like protein
MPEPKPFPASLASFCGSAALFPLPNAVFYPRVLFPLHIFEERYREMTADALEGDRLIAMALLKPDRPIPDNARGPRIHDMVCLSKITAEEKLPDGRYYLVMQGLARARVIRERPTQRLYRIGELELCRDDETGLTDSENQCIRERLLKGIQSLHVELAVNPMFVQALDGELPLGAFCDILAHALKLAPGPSQRILEELNVHKRGRLVLEAIQSELARRETVPAHYPPKFSHN